MPKIRESKNRVRTYRTKVECGECKININQDNIPHHVKSKHPGKSEKDIEFQRITSNNQLTLSGFGLIRVMHSRTLNKSMEYTCSTDSITNMIYCFQPDLLSFSAGRRVCLLFESLSKSGHTRVKKIRAHKSDPPK